MMYSSKEAKRVSRYGLLLRGWILRREVKYKMDPIHFQVRPPYMGEKSGQRRRLMPELPDVEIFKAYLKATSLHKTIEKIEIPNPEMLEDVSPSRLRKAMEGARLQSACRHGKYLFGQMDTGKSLVLHFGMTGFLKYFKKRKKEPSHVRVAGAH